MPVHELDIFQQPPLQHRLNTSLLQQDSSNWTNFYISLLKHLDSMHAFCIIHSPHRSGASDIVAGAVCGTARFVEELMNLNTGVCGTVWGVPGWNPRFRLQVGVRQLSQCGAPSVYSHGRAALPASVAHSAVSSSEAHLLPQASGAGPLMLLGPTIDLGPVHNAHQSLSLMVCCRPPHAAWTHHGFQAGT